MLISRNKKSKFISCNQKLIQILTYSQNQAIKLKKKNLIEPSLEKYLNETILGRI